MLGTHPGDPLNLIPTTMLMARFKPDGSYDSSFGINGKSYTSFGSLEYAYGGGIALRPHGKIVVTGLISLNYENTQWADLVQFLPNGSIDSSFGNNGIIINKHSVNKTGVALKILANNKILAGYAVTSKKGVSATRLVRYLPNGDIDSSFGDNGTVLNRNHSATGMGLAIKSNGKIVEYTVTGRSNILLRYYSNGSKDSSFGIDGMVKLPFLAPGLQSIAIDANGKILINAPDFSISRYLNKGKIDLSFGNKGTVSADFHSSFPNYPDQVANVVLVQPDTKILAIGILNKYDVPYILALARFKDVPSGKQVENTIANLSLKDNQSFTIYPNPVQNIINIRGFSANAAYDLRIINLNGNVIALKHINNVSEYNWNIQGLPNGVYYMNIMSGENIKTLKFIK